MPFPATPGARTKETIFGGSLLRNNPGPGRDLEPPAFHRRSAGGGRRSRRGHPAVPSRCRGGLSSPAARKANTHTHTAPGGGARRHPPFWGGREPQPCRQRPGRSPPPGLASARWGRAGLPPGSGTEPGLVSATVARRGGVRGGAGAGRATKPSAQKAGDQEAQQRRAAAGRAAGGPQLSPRCPPSSRGPPGLGAEPCPAVPCLALPGVGAAAERAGEGGRAAGLPLSRLGPGLA